MEIDCLGGGAWVHGDIDNEVFGQEDGGSGSVGQL